MVKDKSRDHSFLEEIGLVVMSSPLAFQWPAVDGSTCPRDKKPRWLGGRTSQHQTYLHQPEGVSPTDEDIAQTGSYIRALKSKVRPLNVMKRRGFCINCFVYETRIWFFFLFLFYTNHWHLVSRVSPKVLVMIIMIWTSVMEVNSRCYTVEYSI